MPPPRLRTLTAVAALMLAAIALVEPGQIFVGRWLVIDPAGGLIVGVIGIVGLASVLASPSFLAGRRGSLFRADRAERAYWATLFAFWAVLLAVPLAGNLGAAWLAIEATTAASALLVGFSGRARALEAGWKYLILTSLGLGVALLGILILEASAGGGGIETLTWRSLPTATLDPEVAVVGYVLLLAGLAAKIGWAPVHNWLPDAHSEAPAPVSALLSAALLPAVLLVAWRSQQALAPSIGERTSGGVLVGFGLVSIAVAVPFLWRPQAWKRLLAYSSLEHMGVIALGVGFGGPLALAGVAIHVVGHALAKALGFYAATPLLGHEPRAGGHSVGGIGTDATGTRHLARSLARNARRAAAVAALRQRGPDRRGRIPGGAPMGRRRRRDPPRPRVPRPRPRARRHGRRASAPARSRCRARAFGSSRCSPRSSFRCCSCSRRLRCGCPIRRSSTGSAGG